MFVLREKRPSITFSLAFREQIWGLNKHSGRMRHVWRASMKPLKPLLQIYSKSCESRQNSIRVPELFYGCAASIQTGSALSALYVLGL